MILESILLLVSFYIFLALVDNYFPSLKHPPGPFRLPLIGNTLTFFAKKRSVPPFVFFRDLTRKYGPVTYMRMGAQPSVLIDDFDTTKQLLNNEIWIDRPFNDMMAERSYGLPLGIIFVGGDGWREMRRFSTRTLRDFGFGRQTNMQSPLEDETKLLLERIDKIASSKPDGEAIVHFKHLFTMPVLNILWGMISSVRTPEDDEKLKKLLVLVDNLTRATPIGGSILDLFPGLRHVFPGLTGFTFIRQCFAQLQQYFGELLESRRKEGAYREDKRDFIDIFIKEIERHKELGTLPNHYTDEQFITTITDFFEAGSETSSNSLEFAFYYTIKNPQVQRRVQEEIDKVVGRSRLPNSSDRPQMPYTEATLMEVQRMANVLPMTARCPTENTKLNGYDIEKGCFGMVNIYSIHMDEKFWQDPFTFRPERFLDENNEIIPEKAQRVIPFGAGKRVCLGEQMARTTMFTYFTALLQSYTFVETESASHNNNDNARTKHCPLSTRCGSSDPETIFFEKEVHVGFTLSPNPYHARVIRRQ